MRQLEDRIAAVAEGPVSPERDAAARAAAEAAIDAEQPRIEVARPASGPTAARTPGAASDGDGRDEPEPARPDSEQVRTGLRARLAAALGMGRPRAHEDATAQQQQATERRSADPPDASASGRVGGTAESHAPAPRRTSADEIRVAVLVHTLANSEMGSGTLPIASRLDRSKFDVSLVALASLDGETSPPAETTLATVTPLAGPDQAEFAKMLQPDMAESYTDRLAWMSAEARGLAVTLQELGTDVVLAQGFYSALIALMAQRSIPWPVPVVANMHSRANDFVDPSTGGDLYLALIRAMFPQAGAVIAPTEELCEDVVGKFGVPAANVAWVPDPVDGAATRERIESPGATVPLCAPGGSTALWVASPLSGGSLPYVVEGLALARRLEPVRCLVASDASAEFAITSEAARAGVPDAVELVDESSRAGLLQCVSAMLHASSEPETNIPEAIIDAVALGCPVISTTGSEAINEFLGYGERGVLVPRKDAAALAEAILQIIWDPEAARQMTRAAKAHLDEVSADAVLPRLEGILASCVASHDRSSTLQS
jgi:glycosyltransferase involved in cell wall biosynthesis